MILSNLSFSAINLWKQCPSAWQARYVVKEHDVKTDASKFGNAFDQALGRHLNLITDKEVVNTAPEMDETIAFYLRHPWAWKTADSAQTKLTILPDQWNNWSAQFGARSQIKTPIIGYVDFVRRVGIETHVLDLKTSTRSNWQIDWALQCFGLYSLALGAQSAEIHLIVRLKGGLKALRWKYRPNRHLFAWTIDTLGFYANQIENYREGDALAEQPDYYCDWCPKRYRCQGYQMGNLGALSC